MILIDHVTILGCVLKGGEEDEFGSGTRKPCLTKDTVNGTVITQDVQCRVSSFEYRVRCSSASVWKYPDSHANVPNPQLQLPQTELVRSNKNSPNTA